MSVTLAKGNESDIVLTEKDIEDSYKIIEDSSNLGSLSSYSLFVKDMLRYPLFTSEEEEKYTREYKETRDINLRNEIIQHNLRLVVSLAKKYVRVPFAANIHRFRIGSASQHVSRTLSESLQRWLSVILPGAEILDDFMNGEEFFERNSERREDILKFWVHSHLDFMKKNFAGMSRYEIRKFFKTELKKIAPDKNSRQRKIFDKYFPEYEFNFN